MTDLRPLRDFIRQLEARGRYDIAHGRIPKSRYPARPLTELTIREVLAWQKELIRLGYRSTASGGYQFIRKTLAGCVTPSGLTLDSQFSPENQDRMADYLISARGLPRYLSGSMSLESFCNSLAKEWASLPVVTPVTRSENGRTWVVPAGRSYYSGDGLNESLTSARKFLAVVDAIRTGAPSPASSPRPSLTRVVAGAGGVAAGGAVALWWQQVHDFMCSTPILHYLVSNCGG